MNTRFKMIHLAEALPPLTPPHPNRSVSSGACPHAGGLKADKVKG